MRTALPDHLRERLVGFAQKVFWSDEGADHREYVLSGRGIGEQEARQLGLGYIPSRLRSVFREAEVFDLSGRICMPIRDAYGRLVAVSARDIRPDAKLKHFNESFTKANHLYGIEAAKQSMLKFDAAVVVEGQFDVGNLWTKGIRHAVAILGSAMSPVQAGILSRYCSNVYLLMDGDKAGREATLKSLQMARQRHFRETGLHFIAVATPHGKDPDDLTRDEIVSLCRAAKDFYDQNDGGIPDVFISAA